MTTIPNFVAITGPAGAGKTTRIMNIVRDELLAAGYEPEEIQIAGLTHATRRAVEAKLPFLPEDNVMTLAAMCYRIVADNIGNSIQIVTPTKKRDDDVERYDRYAKANEQLIFEWNHSEQGRVCVLPGGTDEKLYDYKQLRENEQLFNAYTANRVRMAPLEEWPELHRRLHRRWTEWKKENDLWDFVDLEEVVLWDELPPLSRGGAAKVLIFDEAQDYSSLDLAVVHHLGRQVDWYYAAGDPNQRIYDWRGGNNNKHFADGAADVVTLTKTWRCWQNVYDAGITVINQWKDHWDYGVVETANQNGVVKYDGSLVLNSELIDELLQRLDEPEVEIAVLSSYRSRGMLDFIGALKARGIPFHNPYTNSNYWQAPGQALARDAVLFAQGAWTMGEVFQWSKRILHTGIFKQGWQEPAKQLPIDSPFDPKHHFHYNMLSGMAEVFQSQEYAAHWYLSRHNSANRQNAERLIHRTWEQLSAKPRIIVGTIHSIKGGEADIVYLCDELSYPDTINTMEWERDCRYYVGITRAKKEVVVIDGEPSERGWYESYGLRKKLRLRDCSLEEVSHAV